MAVYQIQILTWEASLPELKTKKKCVPADACCTYIEDVYSTVYLVIFFQTQEHFFAYAKR
jgi:hypothetical protein